MNHTVKIDVQRCTFLRDYYLKKFDCLDTGILRLPQNHYVHRQLRSLLKREHEFITYYTDNYIELHLPRSDYYDHTAYNKLSENGEATILKELRTLFWIDFDKFIVTEEAIRMGPKMTVLNFMEEYNLEFETFDMLIKHHQRFFNNLKKNGEKITR